MRSSEKTVLAVTISSHAATHVAELIFPATALLVSAEFFGVKDYEKVGLATSISSFLFGLAALPSGPLVDWLGARRVLLIYLFGTAASLFTLSIVPGYVAFTAVLALLGFFAGLYHPAGLTLISLSVEKQGKAMGAHGMGGNLGLALTPFFAAALAEALGGWRTAYAAVALIPLAIGLIVFFSGVDAGARRSEEEKSEPAATAGPRAVRLTPLLLLFAMGVFNGMAYRGCMTFLPAYFSERVSLKGIDIDAVTLGGAITTAVLFIGIVGQMTGGNLADKFKKEKLFTFVYVLACPALFMLGRLEDMALVAASALFAFIYFSGQPVGNSLLPTYTPARVRGLVFGLYFFMNFGVGSAMAYIGGYIGESRHSLQGIFAVFALCLLIAAALGMVLILKTRDVEKRDDL